MESSISLILHHEEEEESSKLLQAKRSPDLSLISNIILSNTYSSNTCSSLSISIPRELIYEILTRVSLSDLVCQCRLVCKDWWRMTTYESSSDFKLTHLQRTPTISGCFIQLVDRWDCRLIDPKFLSFINQDGSAISPSSPCLDFLPNDRRGKEHVVIIQSSSSPHGLFLCTKCLNPDTMEILSYYVCKPATGEWREIPKPSGPLNNSPHSATLKFVIVVLHTNQQEQQQSMTLLHYKIIRMGYIMKQEEAQTNSDRRDGTWYLDCEIFDSNTWEWKTHLTGGNVGSNYNDQLPCFFSTTRPDDPGTLVHGAIHWLSFKRPVICALDVMNGSWKTIAKPRYEQLGNEMRDALHEVQLVEVEGELGSLYLSSTKSLTLELWVLKDYYSNEAGGDTIWIKNYTIDMGIPKNCVGRSFKTLLQLCNRDFILLQIGDEIIWYNCKSGTKTLALKTPPEYSVLCVHPILSDLLPCYI